MLGTRSLSQLALPGMPLAALPEQPGFFCQAVQDLASPAPHAQRCCNRILVAALGHEPTVHRGGDRRSLSGSEEGRTGTRLELRAVSGSPGPGSPSRSCTNAGQDPR